MKGGTDFLRDLLIFHGEDHELIRLPVTIYHQVGYDDGDQQHHEAVNQSLHIVDDKVGAAHDEDVAGQTDAAVGDVAVFTDHQCDDVNAAGVAAPVDGHADAECRDGRPDDDAHEHVIDNRLGEQRLPNGKETAHHQRANQRVDAKFGAQYAPCDGNEDGIKHKCGDADGDFPRGEIKNGGRTCYATTRNFVWNQKGRPPEREQGKSEDNKEVILYFLKYFFEGRFVHCLGE